MIRYSTAILLLASTLLFSASPAMAKDKTKAAPDVTFSTLDGKTVRMADLKGKVVLVDFWASWCIPCRKSFPEIDALNKELASKGLVVLAVTVDEERKNADMFLEKFPHTMTVAIDSKGTLAEAFKVNAMPSTMIVDRTGQIRYSHKGYTDKALGEFRAQVLELLAEAD